MGIRNQQGDHVAKTKKSKITIKELDSKVEELGRGMGTMYLELNKLNNFMIGLENLSMYLAEHLGKKDSFVKFIQEKVDEMQKDLSEKKTDKS
jgi:hypothetical protein